MEPRRETERIEGFSDAVFAIAITLLALDLRVPPPGSPGLLAKLLDQWPEYLAFLATFGTIGVMWVYHHKLFTLIRRADHTLLLLNGLFLLGVVVVPYPTKMLTEYVRHPDANVAAMLHVGTFFMIAVFFNLLWRYASHNRLLDPRVDPQTISVVNRMTALVPMLYLASFFLASVSTVGSSALNSALAVFLAIQKWRDPNIPGT